MNFLNTEGYTMAVATVGRLLLETDSMGYTEKKRNQGRILSMAGRRYFAKLEKEKWHSDWAVNFMEDSHSTGKNRLRDLLVARFPVKIETARLAAINASTVDLSEMKDLVDEQENFAKQDKMAAHLDTEFHLKLAKASRNSVLDALLQLLRKKQEDAEEFESIRRKSGQIYNSDHRKIYEAIEAHDPDLARLMMRRHLETLVSNIERFLH